LFQLRRDFKKWGLPGGIPEERESIEQTMRREILEETSLKINRFSCFGFVPNPSHEIIRYPNGDVIHNFGLLFWTDDFSGKVKIGDDESIGLKFFHPDNLPDGVINNSKKTVQMYRRYRKTGLFQLD